MVKKASNPESLGDAYALALKILQRAAQTEHQVRDKLGRRQFESDVINEVIKKLKDIDLINDQKYSKDYVSYRSRTAPLGPRYLKLKLIQKGIVKETAEGAVKEISAEDELELTRAAAEKKLPHLIRFEPEQRQQKLARFLLSRGFSPGIVFKVIKEY